MSSTISERLGISNEIRELKFGKSFTNTSNNSKYGLNKSTFNDQNGSESFHTIRYDFKPVSVDTSQTATIEFNERNKITVTAPNVTSSCTVFQGSRKPHLKECVLVIDHETGDFTLERLTNNIIVKKTRAEGSSKSKIVNQQAQQQQRPITPANLNNNNQKSISPKLNNQLNGSTKSPPIQTDNLSNNHNSTHRSPKDKPTQQKDAQPVNSMPIFNSSANLNSTATNGLNRTANAYSEFNEIGVLSTSSSSSSNEDDSSESESSSSSSASSSSSDEEEESEAKKLQQLPVSNYMTNSNNNNLSKQPINMSASSSSSEMDSDDEDNRKPSKLNNNLINSLNNGLSNVGISNNPQVGYSMPKFNLNEDLQLSESASDSD